MKQYSGEEKTKYKKGYAGKRKMFLSGRTLKIKKYKATSEQTEKLEEKKKKKSFSYIN